MQQRDFQALAGDFAGRDDIVRNRFDRVVVGVDEHIGFVFLTAVKNHDGETFGFHFRRAGNRKVCFHGCMPSSIVAGPGKVQIGLPIEKQNRKLLTAEDAEKNLYHRRNTKGFEGCWLRAKS